MYSSMIDMYTIPTNFIYFFMLIGLFDYVLIYLFGKKSRWFQLHTITNLYICYLIYGDVKNVLMNPVSSLNTLVKRDSVFTCISLHTYHCVMFNLTPMDQFHHGLFVFLGAVPMLLFWRGPFIQLNMLSTCGLPGAIDYFTLCLVKHNYIHKLTQKNISAIINNYIRFPGTVIASTLCYIGYMENKIILHPLCIIYGMYLTYFNGAYFSKLAIENNMVHKINHRNLLVSGTQK